MGKIFFVLLLFSSVIFAQSSVTVIKLPEPDLNGRISLEQAIKNYSSPEQFTPELLKIYQMSQLCWSAQGITDPNKYSESVSSTAIQLYLALSDGLYFYSPQNHTLEKKIEGDIRPMLSTAAFGQKLVLDSPCIFIITGSAQKMEAKFRGRGEKLLYFETGRVAQNISLQAVTLGLGFAHIGSFDSKTIDRICKFPEGLDALYMVCVGNLSQAPALESAAAPSPVSQPIQQPKVSTADIAQKKVVIILPAKYFNDTEFLGVLNTLQIAGIQPIIASSVLGEIKGLERNTATATRLVSAVKVEDYDAFVFIGGSGMKGTPDNLVPLSLISAANRNNKIIAAIGSATSLFARANIVKGRNVAGSLSERGKLINAGADWKNTSLEISDNMITAIGGYDTTDPIGNTIAQRFGAAVLNALRRQN